MNVDPRERELIELAESEGLTLPMPPDLIVYFERMGKVVDLISGKVYDTVTVMPQGSAKAVAYLLSDTTGAVLI